jgi:hypothetical protein
MIMHVGKGCNPEWNENFVYRVGPNFRLGDQLWTVMPAQQMTLLVKRRKCIFIVFWKCYKFNDMIIHV